MATPTSQARNRVTALLGRCISEAPEALRNSLAQAIEDYASAVGKRTWSKLDSDAQPALFSEVLAAMIENSDARPGTED